jgi:hypothetical protein
MRMTLAESLHGCVGSTKTITEWKRVIMASKALNKMIHNIPHHFLSNVLSRCYEEM